MPRPARKRQVRESDENITSTRHKSSDETISSAVPRTPLKSITNVLPSRTRQKQAVVYTEVEEEAGEEEIAQQLISSSPDQIEKDLQLLPGLRKRERGQQAGQADNERQNEEEEEEDDDDDEGDEEHEDAHSSPRLSDTERAEQILKFEEEQAAKFAEIDDFELNFEAVPEDSFDKSITENTHKSEEETQEDADTDGTGEDGPLEQGDILHGDLELEMELSQSEEE